MTKIDIEARAKAHSGTVFMKSLIAFKAGELVYRGKDREEKVRKQERVKGQYSKFEVVVSEWNNKNRRTTIVGLRFSIKSPT
jgi:hypothetical protein